MTDGSDRQQVMPIEILLVEDDPADELLTREEFVDNKLVNQLTVVRDGTTAMALLRREGPYMQAPRPDLILLDLTLPGLDSRQLLALFKTDPSLASIPVIGLTDSRAEIEILRSQRTRAQAFITRPVEFGAFVDAVRSIDDLYLTVTRRPSGSRSQAD